MVNKTVLEGYEKGKYLETYRKKVQMQPLERFMIDELILRIKQKSQLLDIGCGSGLPFDKYIDKKGHTITGIDITPKHIEQAKKNVKGNFFVADFEEYIPNKKFDAVISFYALFHIRRTKHKQILKKIFDSLKKGGYILITLGAEDMNKFKGDFVGSTMEWNSYSIEKNKELLKKSGFTIIYAVEDVSTEHHLWILAKKNK